MSVMGNVAPETHLAPLPARTPPPNVERARADEPSRSPATVACRHSPTDPYVFSPVRTRAAGPMPISRGVSIHAMGEERVGEVPRA
jgi:hypothetical protein